jgi:hypothetical protein
LDSLFNLSLSLNIEVGKKLSNDAEISSVRGECEEQVEQRENLVKEASITNSINNLEDIVGDLFIGQSKKVFKRCVDDFKCKQTKSNFQLEKLNEAFEKFPNRFPKSERIRLGKEIGLSETQIYKWYYDQKSKFSCKKRSYDFDSDL